MNKIYLDQASTSFPKAPSVAQAVYDYLAGSAVNVNRGNDVRGKKYFAPNLISTIVSQQTSSCNSHII